jgi:outer membrane usher protein
MGIGYVQQTTWQGDETRLLSANTSVRLGQHGQLGFYAMRNFAREPKLTVGVMLTLTLGERASASATVSRYGERNQSTLLVQRSLPAGNGFGYRLLAGHGQFDQLGASAAVRTEQGDFSAEAARIEGRDAYRAGFSGGIAVAGGGAFPSRRINDSFAVVKVDDYPDVRVYRDNQEVTRTDQRGMALITSLRAYQQNPIAIEQADLPLDAEVDTLALRLTPALRSGVVAAFPVRRSRAAIFRLVDEGGQPLPPGTTVRLEGQDKNFSVGYEGKTFVTGLAPHNRLLSEWDDRYCTADLDFSGKRAPLPDLGTIICKGATR